MDTELLVDHRIEDGRKLVVELVAAGFDVSVAFWVKTAEDGLWFLYVGSKSVESSRIGDAYRTLYSCLSKIPDPALEMSEVMLIEASDPIAQDAMVVRDRQSGRLTGRIPDKRLANLAVEEAYFYPKSGGPMTSGEILQTLFGMGGQPTGTPGRPSVFTLRDGTHFEALITGFHLKLPGDLTISTLDPDSGAKRELAGGDVLNIQI